MGRTQGAIAGDHAGLLMQESNGLTGDEFKGAPDSAEVEANDIIKNKENPKYKLFWSGDQATVSYVNNLFAKARPGEQSV